MGRNGGSRRLRWCGLALAGVLVVVLMASRGAAPALGQWVDASSPSAGTPATAAAPGEVLVRFAKPMPAAARAALDDAAGVDRVQTLAPLGVDLMRVRPGGSVARAIATYQAQPNVLYAEPNGVLHASVVPNDPKYAQQWALPKIAAPAAWDWSTGASVTIAILDTGIDAAHPDLAGRVVAGANTLDPNGGIYDGYGHGTHVAGIAAAEGNDGVGVAGVAWSSTLLAVKVLDDTGSGTDASVTSGITYAADHGARVINLSLGGDGSQTLAAAVQYALARNVVVVAAAGNGASDAVECPACYPGVIAVAATTTTDGRAAFSNYGSGVTIAAPGTSIISDYPIARGSYATMSGTSMAAPFVAGASALLLAVHPDWGPGQVRDRLVQTADPLSAAPELAGGRLDLGAALGGRVAPVTVTPRPTISATPSPSPSPSPAVYCGRGCFVNTTPTASATATTTATPAASATPSLTPAPCFGRGCTTPVPTAISTPTPTATVPACRGRCP